MTEEKGGDAILQDIVEILEYLKPFEIECREKKKNPVIIYLTLSVYRKLLGEGMKRATPHAERDLVTIEEMADKLVEKFKEWK
jgi:hypothetical protein